jgi:hypothetical protein
MIEYEKLYIGGDWVRPATSRRIQACSATTEEPVGAVPGRNRGGHRPSWQRSFRGTRLRC